MTKMRRIEADPAGAANLMKELVGRFRSVLVEDEQPLWQGIVHPDGNPADVLAALLEIVQNCVDEEGIVSATRPLRRSRLHEACCCTSTDPIAHLVCAPAPTGTPEGHGRRHRNDESA